MKKLLLIYLITFNLSIMGANYAGAGTGAGAADELLSDRIEQQLDQSFQAILTIHALAKQAAANLNLHDIIVEEVVPIPGFCTFRGEIVRVRRGLYAPWGEPHLVKEEYRYTTEGQDFIEQFLNDYLEQKEPVTFSFCGTPRHALVTKVTAIKGALFTWKKTPISFELSSQKVDWERRMLQHDRWSPARAAWCSAAWRGCEAKTLKASANATVSAVEEPGDGCTIM